MRAEKIVYSHVSRWGLSVMRYHKTVPVVALLAFSIAACARPQTMEECGTDTSCINRVINGDAVNNGAVVGAVGGILGVGAGYATGGPKGAIRGAIIGLSAGVVAGAAVTYYVEHRDASAFVDIQMKVAQYKNLAEVNQKKFDDLRGREIQLAGDLEAARGDNERLTKLIREYRELYSSVSNLISDTSASIDGVDKRLDDFNKAVDLRYGHTPDDIATQRSNLIDQLGRLRRQLLNMQNEKDNYEREIRALEASKLG